MTLWVSPAEPEVLRRIGEVSSVPEQYGVDFLWRAHGQWWGVQRKEVKDLLASVTDGRLSKEVQQMRSSVGEAMVIIEGSVTWTVEGVLMTKGYGNGMWTRSQWDGLMFSLLHEGAKVIRSGGLKETADLVKGYETWSMKEKHMSLKGRPGPQVMWGRPGNKDYQIHLLMGLPGVGYELAKRIVEHFGGIPWRWTVTRRDLMEVEGIGKGKVERIFGALPVSESSELDFG